MLRRLFALFSCIDQTCHGAFLEGILIALMDVFKILLYSSLEMERFPFSFLVHCRFLLLVSQLLSFVFVGFFCFV